MNDTTFYVYLHRKRDSGEVFYVGKGTGNRAYTQSGRSNLWSRIAGKHGFEVEIIADGLTETEAFRQEEQAIASYDGLCNFTDGGEGISGYHHTEETRKALSDAHKGRSQKPEDIEKRAQKLRGKKRSPEFCKQLGDRVRGSKMSEATRRQMSQSHTGLARSQQATDKTAEWHRGKKRSQEARNRMAEASAVKRSVICKTNGLQFASLGEAARWLRANGWEKATKTGVWFSASGKRELSYGMEWDYA